MEDFLFLLKEEPELVLGTDEDDAFFLAFSSSSSFFMNESKKEGLIGLLLFLLDDAFLERLFSF